MFSHSMLENIVVSPIKINMSFRSMLFRVRYNLLYKFAFTVYLLISVGV